MAEAHWLEVSLTVDGELAEAVSEVLSRFASNGVVVESTVKYNDAEDEGTPYGPVRVYAYLFIDEHIEETRQRLAESLWHLGQIQAMPEPQYRTIEDEDWMSSWKKHYHPIPIGQRLLILPAWIESEDPTRLAVRIDPSMAFGTGTHPTTQLCLELIEVYQAAGQDVIDVGCGSGILSIACLHLGANHALAVDIDPASVKATYENAERNHVLERIEPGKGSVKEVRQGEFTLQRAPLVLANILAPVIIRLFDDELQDLLTPGGTLILSGILAEQADGVEAAAVKKGLRRIETRHMGDWVAMAFQ
ncbi:MAG: 50S ribosomal protein L11 methyltransferase [Anaerolineaceae bacterium]|nr:50S ribosomal protein L11 methyltransferase [Anaerolineaceae bacterium]